MRITESQLRKIVRQEAGRLVNRNLRENLEGDVVDGDPASFVKGKMKEIENLFVGGYDPDDAMSDAEMIIEDLCFDLNNMMHDWLMDYLKDEEMVRAEFANDLADDR
jgi:hypothetical protein